jgi:hypothetical protein
VLNLVSAFAIAAVCVGNLCTGGKIMFKLALVPFVSVRNQTKLHKSFVLCNHNPKIVVKHLGGLYNFLKAVSLWAFALI